MDFFVREAAKIIVGKDFPLGNNSNEEEKLLLCLRELMKPDLKEIDLESIMPLCRNQAWRITARMTYAAAVRTNGGYDWSKLIRKEIFTSEFGATPFFLAGLAIGCLRAAIWLDEISPIRTSFSDRFRMILEEFIICQSEPAKLTGPTISDPKYASELSTLVKKWAGGNPEKSAPESWCSKGMRLREVGDVFVHVQNATEDALFGELTPIGKEILNQLCYAAFNSMSVEGRSAAMEYMLSGAYTNRLAEKIAKKSRRKIPIR